MVINNFASLVNHVELQKGKLTFCMLWKPVQQFEKWNVIVSAKWMNKLSEKDALTYWINELQKKLKDEEVKSFLRIIILPTSDPFIVRMVNSYRVTDTPKIVKELAIDNIRLDIVYLLRCIKVVSSLNTGNAQKNPKFNANLNPRFNASLNPRFNASLNPRFNASINPRYNASLNPRYNASINPRYNASLNPRFNASLNPRFNASINPRYNASLHPNSPNFSGLYIYDLSLEKIGYAINATDEVMLIYDMSSTLLSIAVKNDQGFTLFDLSFNWIGYYVKTEEGFLRYDLNNNWLGTII